MKCVCPPKSKNGFIRKGTENTSCRFMIDQRKGHPLNSARHLGRLSRQIVH